MRIAWRMAALLLGGSFVATPAAALLDKETAVDLAAAKALFNQGVVFVDLRNDGEWEAERVAGAHHLNWQNGWFRQETLALLVPDPTQPVVLYAHDIHYSHFLEQAVQKARRWGYVRAVFLKDGFAAWSRHDYPIE